MADTYSTKKINELDTVNSADDSDIMMVGKTSTGTTSAITKGNFLKEVTSTLNSHAGEIVTNAENITTNAGEIKTNANNIAQNTADISTNAADIATNAADIATNAEEIDKLNSALADTTSSLTSLINSKMSITPTLLSDMNNVSNTNVLEFYRYTSDSKNTPYTAGLTTAASGAVISYLSSSASGIQLALPSSAAALYVRRRSSSSWVAWTAI